MFFKWCGIVLLLLIATESGYSQRKTKLDTNGEGTMFFKFGMNRASYGRSNVLLNADDYAVNLENTNISDNSQGNSIVPFFGDDSPQFNFQIGYFIAPKWSLILGFDRYNTFFTPNQGLVLFGTIAPGAHSQYEGTYEGETIPFNDQEFNLVQESGLNFFNVGVLRMDQWYKSRKAKFSFHTLYGAKLGPIFSSVDYTFDGFTRQQITSLSGIGFSAFLGARFDFFQHVFLELNAVGGYLNQGNISLSENGAETAEQKAAFLSPQLNVGFSFFVRPTNGCGTCPQW